MLPWGVMLEQKETLAVFWFFRYHRGVHSRAVVMETLIFGGFQPKVKEKKNPKRWHAQKARFLSAQQNL